MSTIEMPKTYKERLEELQIGDSLPISNDDRQTWANTISSIHKETNKQFTVRTDRKTNEIRVWRLADTNVLSA